MPSTSVVIGQKGIGKRSRANRRLPDRGFFQQPVIKMPRQPYSIELARRLRVLAPPFVIAARGRGVYFLSMQLTVRWSGASYKFRAASQSVDK